MSAPLPITPSEAVSAPAGRLLAWIDGVGAYLFVWGEPLSIGGLSGHALVRVAANLSRNHATISHSGEGTIIEAAGPALVATDSDRKGSGSGRIVTGPTNLADGNELVLYHENSPGVRFRFRCPNALTSTAVLTLASDHRTEPRLDGIILLAEACLLGPNTDAHIRAPDWPGTLVLFRRDGQLLCRSNNPTVPLTAHIKGTEVSINDGAVPVTPNIHITGPGISFRFEKPIEKNP